MGREACVDWGGREQAYISVFDEPCLLNSASQRAAAPIPELRKLAVPRDNGRAGEVIDLLVEGASEPTMHSCSLEQQLTLPK